MKRKNWIIIGVILLVVVMVYSSVKRNFNQIKILGNAVEKQWADVESQYQRRADLIPNLVNTVKGYADFEKETLTGVIEARAKATSVNITPGNLNAESLQQFQQAQTGLSSALSKLMVVVERYPDLKANQNFLELQAQLEGTENRISVERRKYNEAVRNHKNKIETWPGLLYARIFNIQAKPFYEAQEGSEVAPVVEF